MTRGQRLGPDLRTRPAVEDDLAAIVDLMVACDLADIGRADTDASDVEAGWVRAGFDRARDTRVAQDLAARDAVVGYAVVFEGRVEVATHPRALGRGIGSELREFTEARALEQADESGSLRAVTVWQAPRRGNSVARRLLEAAGYAAGHTYSQMETSLAQVRKPRWPEGITVRTYRAGGDDARRLHQLQNDAWAEYPTYEAMTYERWSDLLREPDFDPDLWFLAEAGPEQQELAGMCLCRVAGDTAWVTSLGVAPGRRHQGLGEALLLHAFGVLASGGATTAALSVSSRQVPEARRLYERVGFREIAGWVYYEKELRPART